MTCVHKMTKIWCSIRAIAFLFSNLNTREHESTKTKTRNYVPKIRKRENTKTGKHENENIEFWVI